MITPTKKIKEIKDVHIYLNLLFCTSLGSLPLINANILSYVSISFYFNFSNFVETMIPIKNTKYVIPILTNESNES